MLFIYLSVTSFTFFHFSFYHCAHVDVFLSVPYLHLLDIFPPRSSYFKAPLTTTGPLPPATYINYFTKNDDRCKGQLQQGCTSRGYHVTLAKKFCTADPQIFEPSIWNLFPVTHLAHRILMQLSDFWKILTRLLLHPFLPKTDVGISLYRCDNYRRILIYVTTLDSYFPSARLAY